jgi:hypothetical protein
MKAEDKQKDRITAGARQKDRTIAERGRRTGWIAVFPTGTVCDIARFKYKLMGFMVYF